MTLDPTKEYYGLPVHPVCDMFPMMGGSDFDNLEIDIEANGQLNPVVVHEGQLIDGRNRVLVCQKLRIQPVIQEWRQLYTGKESVADWIWSMNASRRHLSVDQWVAISVLFDAWQKTDKARRKMVEGGKKGGAKSSRAADKGATNSSQAYSAPTPAPARAPDTRKQIATELGVSEHVAQQALNVQKADPELLKKVSRGEIKLVDASRKTPKHATTTIPKRKTNFFSNENEIVPFLINMRAEITRRRIATKADREKTNWNPNQVKTMDLVELVNWIESELDKIPLPGKS